MSKVVYSSQEWREAREEAGIDLLSLGACNLNMRTLTDLYQNAVTVFQRMTGVEVSQRGMNSSNAKAVMITTEMADALLGSMLGVETWHLSGGEGWMRQHSFVVHESLKAKAEFNAGFNSASDEWQGESPFSAGVWVRKTMELTGATFSMLGSGINRTKWVKQMYKLGIEYEQSSGMVFPFTDRAQELVPAFFGQVGVVHEAHIPAVVIPYLWAYVAVMSDYAKFVWIGDDMETCLIEQVGDGNGRTYQRNLNHPSVGGGNISMATGRALG